MITVKSTLVQQTLAGMTLVLVIGVLSMIWPGIFALFLGVLLLLLQSCGAEQEIVMLSWSEISNVPIVFNSLRRPGSPAILS
ncbi:MAG: hypothetical protein H8K07_23340 [Nitrospira sp.]|jgi:hypothetical protein|nr:hypothetical protein [Nitrospira sp.]MDI3465709.1 hypothetical protein [Nitrospira sp.]